MAISNQQVKIRGESINHVVHNQFNHSKVANSSTQAIFLDPNGLSLWPLHSPLKVFVYLPLKETFSIFIALAITYLVWLSNSDLYHIENSNFLWHISRPKCPSCIECKIFRTELVIFPPHVRVPSCTSWVSYLQTSENSIRPQFWFLSHISVFKFRAKIPGVLSPSPFCCCSLFLFSLLLS